MHRINRFLLFIPALDTTNSQVKKQVFELLSALCVYSSEGYDRAIQALERHKELQNLRYRFQVNMHYQKPNLVIVHILNGQQGKILLSINSERVKNISETASLNMTTVSKIET